MTPRRVLLSIIRAKRPPQEVERAIRAVGALAAQMRREAERERRAQMSLFENTRRAGLLAR